MGLMDIFLLGILLLIVILVITPTIFPEVFHKEIQERIDTMGTNYTKYGNVNVTVLQVQNVYI